MSSDVTSVPISLTGPDSHRLVRQPGVGVVTIGAANGALPRPDLVVEPADPIDWEVFNPFTVPAGYPWPRRIVYEGDDTGFARWAEHRPIEDFDWHPHHAPALDASGARISRLAITLRHAPLVLTPPAIERGHLRVTGALGLLTLDLADGAGCPDLDFAPDTLPAPTAEPLRLPVLDGLATAHSVGVRVPPLRQAFDCASLLQCPELRRLSLSGNLANLDALAQLRHLRGLWLRDCPELSGLPPLATWPDLTNLFAFNVDRTTGQRLRRELRASDRAWEDTSVSQLRAPEWFATEYGLPFSTWPKPKAKTAVKAYRAAEQAIATATAPADVETAVRGFVRTMNATPDMYTIEREDAGEAVAQLTAGTPFGDLTEPAAGWFDDERDF